VGDEAAGARQVRYIATQEEPFVVLCCLTLLSLHIHFRILLVLYLSTYLYCTEIIFIILLYVRTTSITVSI
jgi:hypothetical protein